MRIFSGSSRLKRAVRAGIPIFGAAAILSSGALAWTMFGGSHPSKDRLVVGIGDSRNTRVIAPLDEAMQADGHQVFVISGNVTGLYPAGSATLALRVRNPLSQPIRVETITIISGPANSGCSASNLTAGSGQAALNGLYTITLSPPLVVLSGQSVNGPRVPITLLGSAPNACQNATFLLLYSGRATRADGDNDFDNDENDDTQPDQP